MPLDGSASQPGIAGRDLLQAIKVLESKLIQQYQTDNAGQICAKCIVSAH